MPITKATPNVLSPISTTNVPNSIVLRDSLGNFNATTATKLETSRTIALTGSVTGSASFDGSANISIATSGGGGSAGATGATGPAGSVGPTGSTGPAGSAGSGSAKAWVNFNGLTFAIRSSFNVSSITNVSGGVYRVNFASAFSDNNYVAIGGTKFTSGFTRFGSGTYAADITTTSVTVEGISGSVLATADYFGVAIFAN